MTMYPKELTEDWISTLETEKIQPWSPAGSPMVKIFPRTRRSMVRHRRLRRRADSSFIRVRAMRMAEMAFEILVAMATPATPRLQTSTKNRFSTTFTIPAAIR